MSHRSKFGLPRNIVTTNIQRAKVFSSANIWLRTKDEFEGLWLDAKDAFEAGLIGRREYEKEQSRLKLAIWSSEQRYLRATRPRPRSSRR